MRFQKIIIGLLILVVIAAGLIFVLSTPAGTWRASRSNAPVPPRDKPVKSIPADEIREKLRVQYGKSVKFKSDVRSIGPIGFALARIELEGSRLSSTDDFADYALKKPISGTLAGAIDQHCDAVWIKGRIQKEFDFEFKPADDGLEKSFSDVEFAAVIKNDEGKLDTIPFHCVDYYGDSALMFSQHAPPEKQRKEIAAAFWDLMLNDQGSISDYSDSFYHPGCGKSFKFSVKDGKVYIAKSWNELASQHRNAVNRLRNDESLNNGSHR